VSGDVVAAGAGVVPVSGVRRGAARQIRSASRIIATANGNMNSTTMGPMAQALAPTEGDFGPVEALG
jgi:hypothetical protein